MEEVSGTDLGWFFHQWLSRAGSPVVEGSWQYDAISHKVTIDLTQAQPGDAYRLPLEVGVTTDGVLKLEKIELTQRRQRFEIAAAKAPGAVALDPNTWVLMEQRFGKQ